MALDERTRKGLDDIFATIEERKETFEKVLIGFAFSRGEKNECKLSFGYLHFLRKGQPPLEDMTLDYGNFVLMKRTLDVIEAVATLHSILENQTLMFEDLQPVSSNVHLGEIVHLNSNKRYWYSSNEWPMLYTYFRIDDSVRGNIPSDSLAKLGLPLFPSGAEAINVFFGLHLAQDWSTLESRIELLVPDYRAKIKNLRLAGNRITLEVETGEIAEHDLRGKFYCKDKRGSCISEDLPLKNGLVSFVAENEPLLVEAHIISTADGKSIDKKSFDYRYPSQEGVILENIETQLIDIIAKGESASVEFKEKLDNGEFLESVVSFANTAGGTIFLGVDDNCRVKGLRDDVKDRILNLVIANCDPSIDIQVDSGVEVQGTPITLVKVPEGMNKPYVLRDRGVFLRRGSSDRQAKRIELDDIYTKKQGSQWPLR